VSKAANTNVISVRMAAAGCQTSGDEYGACVGR
jgi:hypothetical protein